VAPAAGIAGRRLVGELMDDPALDPGHHRAALLALGRLNVLWGAHRIVWPSLRELAAIPGHGVVRVLDIATGSGDIPVRLMRLARREGLPLRVEGCDASEVALAAARERAARAGLDMNFFQMNASSSALPGEYDVVMCSLFLHHLTNEDARGLLYRMRCAARRMVLVSDIIRSAWGLRLATIIPRLLTRSRVMHEDAVRSIRAAFTVEELRELAGEAGLEGADVSPRPRQRMLLTWRRP
jgi:2-polyprenyl-3-methyl-5-hydroxy-6-metoxy-1,4-benzoquinol methylase